MFSEFVSVKERYLNAKQCTDRFFLFWTKIMVFAVLGWSITFFKQHNIRIFRHYHMVPYSRRNAVCPGSFHRPYKDLFRRFVSTANDQIGAAFGEHKYLRCLKMPLHFFKKPGPCPVKTCQRCHTPILQGNYFCIARSGRGALLKKMVRDMFHSLFFRLLKWTR